MPRLSVDGHHGSEPAARGEAELPRLTRFDDRWRWIVTAIVPRFRRLDADVRLVDSSLRRIFDEALDYGSSPCVLPRSAQIQDTVAHSRSA
jgi:hypothetical protein